MVSSPPIGSACGEKVTAEQRAILVTLVVYKLVLVGIGFWASRRTHDNDDFFLGGRRLGPFVAAISASASSSSAWTLLGVSGAAYLWGLPAVWLFPATVGGFLINWLFVAPRMRASPDAARAVTLTHFLAGDPGQRHFCAIVRLSATIVLFSFLFYVASQFQAAGKAFSSTFEMHESTAILIGAGVILVYTLLGGFWAVSVTDTLQGALMALTAVLLPLGTLAAVGGFGELHDGLRALDDAALVDVTGKHAGIAALGFVVGTLGIGFGYPGQPHVVNRFLALKDDRAMRQARIIAIAWALVVYSGMLTLGFCARILYPGLADNESIFFAATTAVFPPVIAGIMVAAVLSAIMSTADSQLLVAASSVSHDWPLTGANRASPAAQVRLSRVVVTAVSAMAVLLALYATDAIFSRVLFAWHALGSAFGPVLLVRLAGRPVSSGATLAGIATGFALTVALHLVPNTPGDVAERWLPFVASLLVCLAGRRDVGSATRRS